MSQIVVALQITQSRLICLRKFAFNCSLIRLMDELEAADARWDVGPPRSPARLYRGFEHEHQRYALSWARFCRQRAHHSTGASSQCAQFRDRSPRPQSINVPWSMHPSFTARPALTGNLTATALRQSALCITQQRREMRPADSLYV